MLIAPSPTATVGNLIKSLESVHAETFNLAAGGGGTNAFARLMKYLDWATRSARMPGSQIREKDLTALVLTRRYEMLLTSFGGMASTDQPVQRVVSDVVSLELNERVTDLDDAIATLKAYKERWSNVPDVVVLDTCFYIHHPEKLEEADIVAAADLPGTMAQVLVPMVVVDELDGLKQHSKQDARWRARYSVAVLDRVFRHGTVGQLHPDNSVIGTDGSVSQDRVTMELLLDPPGHTRLPIADDEIID